MSKRFITAAVVTVVALFAVAARAETAKMIKSLEITMADGTKATVYVFETKNGGGQLVAIPAEKISEDMRRRLF